jgi:hypothetical protein
VQVLHIDFYFAEGHVGCEGNGGRAENFRRVVEEDFIHDAGGESGPVHRGSAFDHHAGNFKFTEAAQNGGEVWVSVGCRGRKRFYAHALRFQFCYLPGVGGRSEDREIAVVGGVGRAGFRATNQL